MRWGSMGTGQVISIASAFTAGGVNALMKNHSPAPKATSAASQTSHDTW